MMTPGRSAIAALAVASACGDDPTMQPDAFVPTVDAAPLTCGTTGAATVNGSIGGETISPVVRAVQSNLAGTPAILIDESGVGCASPDVNTTDYLALIYCSPSTVATYPVSGTTPTMCPGLRAGAALGYTASDGSHPLGSATGGTFTIESISASCIIGSFAVTFDADQIAGRFAAIACP
jgi:hypothetical protein